MVSYLENELPDRLLAWVIASVNPQAAVHSVSRLYGGISSIVHSVSLLIHGTVEDYVLRQFDNEEWLNKEPDLARHEAENLRWASRITHLPTPQIIAFDPTGETCGVPAVLMTKLVGSVVLIPPEPKRWLHGLAQSLAKIHEVDAGGYPWTYFTYMDLGSLETSSWSSFPELWNTVHAIVKGPRPDFKPCFIHRDYHPTNVLWSQDQVSGVVDWVNACQGPAGIDLGHCRVNLAMLFGISAADDFLLAYQHYSDAAFSYDPYWDLLSLIDILFGPPQVYPGWTKLGVTGLTDELIVERVDNYMISLLERWNMKPSSSYKIKGR